MGGGDNTTYYWFNDDGGAVGDGLLASANSNDSIDGENNPNGNWGAPGSGDDLELDDAFSSDDITVAVSRTIGRMVDGGIENYSGLARINDGVTLTMDVSCAEFNHLVCIGDVVSEGDLGFYGVVEGGGTITIGWDLDGACRNADFSGFTGKIVFDPGDGVTSSIWGPFTTALPALEVAAHANGTVQPGLDVSSFSAAALTMTSGTFQLNDCEITIAGNISGTGGVMNFSTGIVDLAGTLDGDAITFANSQARLKGGGAVQNVDASGIIPINAVGCKRGVGNKNVVFGEGGTVCRTATAA